MEQVRAGCTSRHRMSAQNVRHRHTLTTFRNHRSFVARDCKPGSCSFDCAQQPEATASARSALRVARSHREELHPAAQGSSHVANSSGSERLHGVNS